MFHLHCNVGVNGSYSGTFVMALDQCLWQWAASMSTFVNVASQSVPFRLFGLTRCISLWFVMLIFHLFSVLHYFSLFPPVWNSPGIVSRSVFNYWIIEINRKAHGGGCNIFKNLLIYLLVDTWKDLSLESCLGGCGRAERWDMNVVIIE